MFAYRAQPRILKRVACEIRRFIEPPLLLRLVRVVASRACPNDLHPETASSLTSCKDCGWLIVVVSF
jgi:hypothetical protein